jgi:hypothetical protein
LHDKHPTANTDNKSKLFVTVFALAPTPHRELVKKYQMIAKNKKLTINKGRYSKMDKKEFPFSTRSYCVKIQDYQPRKLN